MATKRPTKEVSNFIKEYNDALERLAVAYPRLYKLSQDQEAPFRGLTIFTGDAGNLVIGARRWGPDGKGQVLWTSGDDLVLALLALERALATPKWRNDKKV